MSFCWSLVVAVAFGLAVSLTWADALGKDQLTAENSARVAEEVSKEYTNFLETDAETPKLMQLVNELRSSIKQKDIFSTSLSDLTRAEQYFTCTMCRTAVKLLARTIRGPLGEDLWSLWSKWLPKEAETTIRRGGYYTLSPSEGHRIISLNSMDCYLFNWWIYYNGSIVLDQLQWLHDTLLAAEEAQERVHILTHIPAGDSDCWTDWSREYNRLVARFSRTITGIFNGHTHMDEMNLHYTKDNQAVAVSWNGGSLTTYADKNPNYRLYDLSPETWQVVDHQTWIFNLTEANLQPDALPNWQKEYEFSKEFGNNTSPAGIDRLLEQMAKQPKLLRKFWRIKMTNADPKLLTGCNDKCLKETICRLATSNYKEQTRCHELEELLEKSLDKERRRNSSSLLKLYSFSCLLGLLLTLQYVL